MVSKMVHKNMGYRKHLDFDVQLVSLSKNKHVSIQKFVTRLCAKNIQWKIKK